MTTSLALLLAAAVVVAPPPIAPGDYAQEGVACADAPLAAMMSFNGRDFSGPHATDCTGETLSHAGNAWTIRTTCTALGDGTPTAPSAVVQTVRVLSRTRVSVSSPGARGASIFRLCPTQK